MHGAPQDFQVNPIIFVDKLVAHGYHVLPRHLRITAADACWDVPSGFTNDFEGPHHRKVGHAIGGEGREVHAFNEFQGLVGSLVDIS